MRIKPRHTKAVSALLSRRTLTDAATAAGVNERTLRRWLDDEQFLDLYHQARRQAVSVAVGRLQSVGGCAVRTLEAILKNARIPAHARVTAARAVLDMAMRGVEIEDIEVRINRLERRQRDTNP